MYPTLQYEKVLWKKGYKYIAGIDEVGRGALAGPVVVAAVIFPQITRTGLVATRPVLEEIRDSKLLTPKSRESLFSPIRKYSLDYSFGQSSISEINRHGIFKATLIAMRRALTNLKQVDFVLIDSFHIPYTKDLPKKKQLPIKHGDKHCFTIAAASILAKVHRDRLMTKLSKSYPQYQLNQHKGYGTPAHRQAIQAHGPKPVHRKLFIRKII